MNSRRSEKKQSETYISAVDFQRYLKTLPEGQRQELRQFMENHPQVESMNRGIEKFYRGSPAVLREIEYLIDQSRQRSIETSFDSYVSSGESKLFTERIPSLTFSEESFAEITKKIAILKRIERYPLQMTVRGREETSSESEIYITTRCRGTKRIYFIFDHFHELVQLQALIDMEWKLDTITTIRQKFQKFQKGKNRLLRNSYNNYDLYFFQRTGPDSWQMFIPIINKQNFDPYLILMKFSLFDELYANRHLFTVLIRLAFDSGISLPGFAITQLKVFSPEVDFISVHELAMGVLRKNECEYKLEDELFDCITSYNCILLQQRGQRGVMVVRPDEASSKEFVYFTFYAKLMEVVRSEGQIVLVERVVKEEFPNSLYRNSLEDVLKEAAVNQCPFFYFCQLPREVVKVSFSQCRKVKSEDANRLLYYRTLLEERHYKASSANVGDVNEIVERLERPFLFKFQCEQIVSKMGKIKSSQIMKKYREGAKGCILASPSFCRQFMDKLVDVSPPK